ncbi:MAG: hypothetical protein IJ493_02850 [Clostridia bacterium]|nr:hypothetical protein [Clostridia bacterium]
MTIFLIFLCIFTASIQSVLRKQYNQRAGEDTAGSMFNAAQSLTALCFFVVSALAGGMHFPADPALYAYSIGFAAAYGTAVLFSFLALAVGPFGLTSLISSYSLVLPTLYGLIFLGESLHAVTLAGLGCLFVSLWLMRADKSEGERKINLRWIVYVLLSFAGNGFCSIIQKAQQNAFDGAYKNEFMIAALALVTAGLFIAALVSDRSKFSSFLRQGAIYALLCGAANGATNLLVMVITATVAASIFFPVISAGQIITAFAFSLLLYKEKLSKRQHAGAALGIAALVLLNQ